MPAAAAAATSIACASELSREKSSANVDKTSLSETTVRKEDPLAFQFLRLLINGRVDILPVAADGGICAISGCQRYRHSVPAIERLAVTLRYIAVDE